MERFRTSLRAGGDDVRTALLDDLATYHGISREEAVRRCRQWEADSVEEWSEEDRDDEDALLRFYRSTQSWGFDLVWFAYLQAEGFAEPTNVITVKWLNEHFHGGRRHLDFGSGAGAGAEAFLANGWTSTLADVSSTLLDLAAFRLKRRGLDAGAVDLGVESLPTGAFDAITALDTITHVPDVHATALDLHRALADGGVLLANFDVRPPSPENAWHLYADDLMPRYHLESAGFRPIAGLPYGIVVYRRLPHGSTAHRLHRAYRWLTLASPLRRGARRLRLGVLRTAARFR
ncbi:class I SAM-dependent methyltransferase [Actinomycetospora aeridis]|uniref:Class I SAM-dependent methyltransferase n=1 Tax=Actinomycetospora aeridis TaxID=3129231 RepID=A0ABU8N9A4_9PSEU